MDWYWYFGNKNLKTKESIFCFYIIKVPQLSSREKEFYRSSFFVSSANSRRYSFFGVINKKKNEKCDQIPQYYMGSKLFCIFVNHTPNVGILEVEVYVL